MSRPFPAFAAWSAIAALPACFNENNGGSPPDASFSFPDVFLPDTPTLPEATPPRDATLESSVMDAPPEVAADSPEEPRPEPSPEASPEPTPEASIEASVEAGPADATLPEAAVDAAFCARPTDCPPDFACDTSTGQCVSACGGATETACNGGCCASGRCAAGTANGACGNDGAMCSACANGTPTCSAAGMCTAACGQPNDGTCGTQTCCQRNACVQQGPTSCGANCIDCTGNAAGSGCVNGACGCTLPTDCPPGFACDTQTNSCTQGCNANTTACNGGCCDIRARACAAGNSNLFCGNTGAQCVTCSGATPTCNADGTCH